MVALFDIAGTRLQPIVVRPPPTRRAHQVWAILLIALYLP